MKPEQTLALTLTKNTNTYYLFVGKEVVDKKKMRIKVVLCLSKKIEKFSKIISLSTTLILNMA